MASATRLSGQREGSTQSLRQVALASFIGTAVEWYDFFLYGTAAGLVFDKLYFNGLDGPAAQFAAFGTFAVGFAARPVGGIIFGHFGDRVGRKSMLVISLLIMGIATAMIGLLLPGEFEIEVYVVEASHIPGSYHVTMGTFFNTPVSTS